MQKFKQGQSVVAQPGRGEALNGRYAGTRNTESGAWIDVNMAPKGKPSQIKSFRPAQVKPG